MSYNRNLQTFDFANMASQLPDSFLQIYKSMTKNQCNEIIFAEDENGTFVVDQLNTSQEKIEALVFIINNLSDENFEKFCSRQDKNKQTLLHRLASLLHTRFLIKYLMTHLKPKTLAKIITLQDKSNKTILHMPQVLLYINLLDSKDTDVSRAVNAAILMQDNIGYTPYHYMNILEAVLEPHSAHFSNFLEYHYKKVTSEGREINDFIFNSKGYLENQPGLEILLQFTTDETLDKLLLLKDKKGNCFLEYRISKYFNLDEVNKNLYIRMANLKSENYTNLILKVLKKLDSDSQLKSATDVSENACHKLLKISSAYVSISKNYKFLFESVRTVKCYPALFFLLESCGTKVDINTILVLFNIIPPEEFFKNLNRLSDSLIDPITSSLANLFKGLAFLPYRQSDPLTALKTFYLTHKLTEISSTKRYVLFLNPNHHPRYERDEAIRQNPIVFTTLMTKIVRYQISLANKCNPRYLEIVIAGAVTIRLRDVGTYPDTNNYFTNCLNQLQLIATYLEKFIKKDANINALLAIDPSGIINSDNCEFAAAFCTREVEGLPESDVRKISYDLHALCFQRQAAEIASHNAEIIHLDAEEKVDNEDEKKAPAVGVEHKTAIYNLNVKVYKYLNLIVDNISHVIIDQEKYELALVTMYDHLLNNLNSKYDQNLSEFGEYIALRSQAKPSLFANAEKDFIVRKAYYDILKTRNDTAIDVESKITTLTSACNNNELKSGRSKRCLAFMIQMKDDLGYYIYLNNVKASMPRELAVNEIFRAGM